MTITLFNILPPWWFSVSKVLVPASVLYNTTLLIDCYRQKTRTKYNSTSHVPNHFKHSTHKMLLVYRWVHHTNNRWQKNKLIQFKAKHNSMPIKRVIVWCCQSLLSRIMRGCKFGNVEWVAILHHLEICSMNMILKDTKMKWVQLYF